MTLLDNPAFAKYPDFKELLNTFASANCHGCRKQDCHLFKECKVKDCHKTENVDYCFQCSKFPCKDTGFDNNLKQRWLKINSRILEIGLDNYYVEFIDDGYDSETVIFYGSIPSKYITIYNNS